MRKISDSCILDKIDCSKRSLAVIMLLFELALLEKGGNIEWIH